jgi:hypothetical protein
MLCAVFPPSFLSAMNMYLLALAVVIGLASRTGVEPTVAKALLPFGIIIAIGVGVGVGADRYLVLKDGWYVSNPAVTIAAGYVFWRAKPDLARGLRAFVIGGTIVAAYRLSVFGLHPDLLELDAASIRQAVGTGNYAPALALTILCAHWRNWRDALRLPTWIGWPLLALCGAGVGMSFSRTMLAVAAGGVLVSMGFLARRQWIRVGALLLAALIAFGLMRATVDIDSNAAQRSFVGKLARSLDELVVSDYSDFRSININWRGYETSRALQAYANGTPLEWLVGQGFGAQVDLGLFMPLGVGSSGERELVRFVPILHNGYAYLLVKGGMIAVLLFLMSLALLLKVASEKADFHDDKRVRAASRIMQASVITIAFTTYVVSGAFNKLDMFPYLLAIGFLLGALVPIEERAS